MDNIKDAMVAVCKTCSMRDKYAAAIVDNKYNIITICTNQPYTHIAERKTGKMSYHAEELCIDYLLNQKKNNKLRKYTLVLLKTGMNEEIRPSAPCKNCQRLIDKVGIKLKIIKSIYSQ